MANPNKFQWNPSVKKAFEGAFLKLERAKAHINEIEQIIDSLSIPSANPIRVRADIVGNYRVDLTQLPPQSTLIPIVIGDALHNLRSALDHVWNALDREVTGKAGIHVYFPFDESRPNLVLRLKRDPVILAYPQIEPIVLQEMKPYRTDGGDLFFWSLTKLNKIDKHNLLVPTIEIRRVEHLEVRTLGRSTVFENCTFGGPMTLVASDAAPECFMYGKILVEPIFAHDLPTGRSPIVKVLNHILDVSQSGLRRIEALES